MNRRQRRELERKRQSTEKGLLIPEKMKSQAIGLRSRANQPQSKPAQSGAIKPAKTAPNKSSRGGKVMKWFALPAGAGLLALVVKYSGSIESLKNLLGFGGDGSKTEQRTQGNNSPNILIGTQATTGAQSPIYNGPATINNFANQRSPSLELDQVQISRDILDRYPLGAVLLGVRDHVVQYKSLTENVLIDIDSENSTLVID